jgi:hypothetical protein
MLTGKHNGKEHGGISNRLCREPSVTLTDLEQGGLHALIRVALLVKRPPPLRP